MEDSKGKRIKYEGNYGQGHYDLLPIPEHPRTIVDKWGFKWLYLGKTDEEFARVAKSNPDGSVDIASLGHMRYDYFPCFQE